MFLREEQNLNSCYFKSFMTPQAAEQGSAGSCVTCHSCELGPVEVWVCVKDSDYVSLIQGRQNPLMLKAQEIDGLLFSCYNNTIWPDRLKLTFTEKLLTRTWGFTSGPNYYAYE